MVELEFRDHGMGIPAHLLGSVFDVKKRTSRSGTEGETGVGFGMPLVKKFIHLYRGSITIESRSAEEIPEDSGTSVILSLPAAD